jgi:myo-inositol 2-dehydrogenase / D-chiro-inositol 1-dehydrogenase
VTVRLGLVGAGVMGTVHAENIVRRVPGTTLVAVADRVLERATSCGSRLDVDACFGSARKMFAQAELDGVVICTPADTHAQIITAAANYGLHVFVEKPLDRDLHAADAALAAAKRAGVKLQVGFQRRFDDATCTTYESLRAGSIGDPLTIHIVARDPARASGVTPPGDLFFETTVHDLDLAAWMLDSEPEWVFATSGARGGLDNPDYAVITVTFTNGAVATIDNSRLARYGDEQRIEIAGPDGTLHVGNRDPLKVMEDARPFFIQRYDLAYISEMREFVHSISKDLEPPVTGHDGRRALAMALAAWRSYQEHRPIQLSGLSS